jgi:myb proto-oncogene protein
MCEKQKKSKSKFHQVKGAWSDQEDAQLMQQVSIHGPKKWSLIATTFTGRVGKQCRERWFNHLDPCVVKTQWSEEEDGLIYKLHADFGNQVFSHRHSLLVVQYCKNASRSSSKCN